MRRRTKVIAVAVTGAALVVAGITAAAASSGDTPNGRTSAQPAARVRPALATPATTEATFVPVQPCRIVDTRLAGGKIAPNTSRSFNVRGTTGFTGQGGTASGCGVPGAATGVALNVTVVQAGGNGYLTGYPAGTTAPLTNFVTYWQDRTVTANPTIALAPPGTNPALAIKNVGAATHVIIDVTGYFAPQMAGFVESDGTLTYTSGRVLASSHPSTGNYEVTFDRDVSQCSYVVTPYAFNYVVAVGPSGLDPNAAHVYIHDQGTSTTSHDTSFFITAVC